MNHRFLRSMLACALLFCMLLSGCDGSIKNNSDTTSPAPIETTAPATSPVTDPTEPEDTLPDGPVTYPVETEAPSGEDLPGDGQQDEPQYPEDTRPRPSDPDREEEQPTQPPAPTVPNSGGFKVYFIDVGQADAALVICDGRTMLIDGGNAADSSLMYSFLKDKGVSHLDYVIATHAHEDHVGGLAGALNYATVGTVYCPTKSYSSNAFQNFASSVQKRGKSITVPSNNTSFSLGSASCTVLAVNTTADTNNTSIVLRIVYGSTSFLFTGDAEREVEEAMINRGVPLRSTVLKVGHHGSYTSTSYQFLWNVMPTYGVISCGKDNSYGHPHDQVLSRLKDADVYLFRTDMQGTITCTSNGSSVSFSVSRNWNANVYGDEGNTPQPEPTAPPDTQPPESEPPTIQPPETEPPTDPSVTEPPAGNDGTDYVLNTSSMKFHLPGCEWAEKISNRNRKEYTGHREDLLDQGYTPCGSCDP